MVSSLLPMHISQPFLFLSWVRIGFSVCRSHTDAAGDPVPYFYNLLSGLECDTRHHVQLLEGTRKEPGTYLDITHRKMVGQCRGGAPHLALADVNDTKIGN